MSKSKPIELADVAALDHEIRGIAAFFEANQRETEENWTKMEDLLVRLTAIVQGCGPAGSSAPGAAAVLQALPLAIKTRLKTPINNCLLTERTRLARTSLVLIEALARTLRDRFELLSDTFLPTVLKLTARANKVYVGSASAALRVCISSAGLVSFMPHLAEAGKNQSKTMRIAAMESFKCVLDSNSVERLTGAADLVESILACSVLDSTVEVRDLARSAFESYAAVFPDRVARFVDKLPDTARKYIRVDKKVLPRAVAKTKTTVRMPSRESVRSSDDLPVQHMSASASGTASGSANLPSSHSIDQTVSEPSHRGTLAARLPLQTQPALGSATAGASSAFATLGRRTLGEPARVVRQQPDQSDANRPAQNRVTHLTEHLGGAQRVVRTDKPAGLGVSAAAAAVVVLPANTASASVPFSSAPGTLAGAATVLGDKSKFQRPARLPSAPSSVRSYGPSSTTDAGRPPSQPTSSQPVSGSSINSKTAADASSSSSFGVRRSQTSLPRTSEPNRTSSSSIGSVGSSSSISSHNPAGGMVRPESAASFSSNHGLDDSPLDVNKLRVDIKSSEWSTRSSVLQTITAHLSRQRASETSSFDLRSKTGGKILEIVVAGLGDAHYRVIHVALQTVLEVIQMPNLPVAVLEQLLPKVASVHYSPIQRSKHGVGQVTETLVDLLREMYGGDVLCSVMAQALGSTDHALKVRVGCIGFLADLSAKHWEQYLSKPGHSKIMLTRLAPIGNEQDAFVNKSMRFVLQTMYEANSDAFTSAMASLRSNDKRLLNMVFGKDIEADKSVLIRSPMVSRTAHPGSPSLSGKGSPRINYDHVSPKVSARKPRLSTSSSRSSFFKSADELEDNASQYGEDHTDVDTETDFETSSAVSSRRASAVGVQDSHYPTSSLSDSTLPRSAVWSQSDDHADSNRVISASSTPIPSVVMAEDHAARRTPTPRNTNNLMAAFAAVSASSAQDDGSADGASSATPTARRTIDRAATVPNTAFRNSTGDAVDYAGENMVGGLVTHEQLPSRSISLTGPPLHAKRSLSLGGLNLGPSRLSTGSDADSIERNGNTSAGPTASASASSSPFKPTKPAEPLTFTDDDVADVTKLRHALVSKDRTELDDLEALVKSTINEEGSVFENRSRQLMAVVRALERPESTLGESQVSSILETALTGLLDLRRRPRGIKSCLVVLRSLITHHTQWIAARASSILMAVLECRMDPKTLPDDVLDVDYETASLVSAFEQSLPPAVVVASALAALDRGLGMQICYDLISRHVGSHGDVIREDDDVLVDLVAKGLDSKLPSLVRKPAFECAAAISASLPAGSDWIERLYAAVRTKFGVPRETILRKLMSKN
ncbi:clasp N terminal-domain-containing protein [Entophlyctis helioformis]|nr:clasp N terminal-domain-containing protein [Entophlyctis helioformis]